MGARPQTRGVEAATGLYTAVICDILDGLGLRAQTLPSTLRPLDDTLSLVGRASTVQAIDDFTVRDDPYTDMLNALDALEPGTVVVVAGSRSDNCANWGELSSNAAMQRGAVGTVVDGPIRDTARILGLRYPVYATGTNPLDAKGRSRVVESQCRVEIGGVGINPGDLIFGDRDGVVVIPPEVEEEVIALSHEKVSKESLAREELRAGAYLRDIWARHRVM